MNAISNLDQLEADLLFSAITVNDVQPLPLLKPHPAEISIQRTENLDIRLELRGTLGPEERLQNREVQLGTVSEGESTSAKSLNGGRAIELNGITSTGRPNSTDDRGFKDRGSLFRITEDYQVGAVPHSSIMYLLGRPTALLWGNTERNFLSNEIQIHRRDYPELGSLQTIKFPASDQHGGGFSRDCLLLKSKRSLVLYSFGSENGLTRMFQPSYFHFIRGKEVADEDARRNFLEAFNFALGKRFVEIGHTELDQSNAFIRRSSRTPYSYNLKREVLTPELPPSIIHTDSIENDIDCERVSKIVDLYLDAHARMNLSEVMWKIWTARAMPLGQQLVAYGAALESLINAWFEMPENKDRSVYVTKKDFKDRTREFRDQLRNTTFPAEDTANWKRVIGKLDTANEFSLADRLKHFLSGMGLASGEVEDELWLSRNLFAHGNNIKDADAKRLVVLRRGYEALLNRCILKVIGYDGNYRDYSCMDFPERPLVESLKGPNGDGKI